MIRPFLKQKHPTSSELNEEVLLRGEKPSVYRREHGKRSSIED